MRIGYARVSTDEQNLSLQIDALTAAGCERIYKDEGIPAVARDRPEFAAALAALKPGDTLVIWKMDRAFRSLLNALQVLDIKLGQIERGLVTGKNVSSSPPSTVSNAAWWIFDSAMPLASTC